MKRVTVTMRAALMALACAGVVWTVTTVTRAVGPTINLTPFATAFHGPIGIDFFEPTVGSGQLIATAFYPSGDPYNFELIDAAGVHAQFSTLHFLPQELKVATVRASACTGGFAVGTAYAGNGIPGQILKINPDGTFVNPWATLPGETNHIRGSLYQDRACAVDGDLVVVTGNEQIGTPGNDFAGNVWRVNSFGVATKVATINRHLEGVITLPGDAAGQAKYGPLAGNIVAGDEDLIGPNFNTYGPNGRLWIVAPNGAKWTVGVAYDGTIMNYPTDVPLHIEDIELIPSPRPGFASPEGDLFVVDYGGGQILRAPASDFADKCGDLLITQEFRTTEVASGLSTLKWDAVQQKFVVTPLTNTGSAVIGHFEHVTYWGGTECPPSVSIIKYTNGADANDPNAAGVPNINAGSGVTWTYKVTNTGSTSVPKAQVVVTDNTTGVTPTFTSEISGNGDTIFNPGEMWLYTATGTALDLTLPAPPGVHTVPNSCTAGGSQLPRTAYTNVGTVTIPGASATDPSSYCNPPPNVTIIKYTNGADANDPNAAGVPNINAGGLVTWTYKVTNTGQTSVPKAQVVVTDNTTGVTPTFTSEISGNGDMIFNPGEMWLYTATGTALDLTLPPPPGVHTVPNSCSAGGSQLPRTAYTNVGTVTIPGATASDPSSYCNPPPQVCTATMGDFVWYDLNLNGKQDAGEPGRVGVTVNLLDSTGTMVLQTTMTNASGGYSFSAACGTYKVQVVPPMGFALTLTNAPGTTPANDSNVNPTMVSLPGGGTDNTIDWGLVNERDYCPPAGSPAGSPSPIGKLFWTVNAVNGDVTFRYDQTGDPVAGPNDNSYGANQVGWVSHSHTFGNLTGSDKAEFIFTNSGGTKVLDFFIDYLTTKSGTPSGYASLGPDGGDGSLVSGLRANILSFNTSLAHNLNDYGYCVGGNCAVLGTNLVVDSPPTVSNTSYVLPGGSPYGNWNFQNSYEGKISGAAFGGTGAGFGDIAMGLIHNSPPKNGPQAFIPVDCAGVVGGGCGSLTITTKKLDKKEVQITIDNGGSADSFLNALSLTWPAANGKLVQIKLDGDVVYDNPDLSPPSANLTTAQLVADQNKRKINHGSSDVLHLIFEHDVDKDASHYTGTVTVDTCVLTILP